MSRLTLTAAAAGAVLAVAAVATPVAASAASGAHHSSERTCASPRAGFAACLARVVTDSTGHPIARKVGPNATPSGHSPADIRTAYNLSTASGSGRTVAIVDAYNDPTAEADLGVYRAQYGL